MGRLVDKRPHTRLTETQDTVPARRHTPEPKVASGPDTWYRSTIVDIRARVDNKTA